MKIFLLLLSFIFLPFSLKSETLDCFFDDYSQSTYPLKMAKSWVPENQTIKIEDDKVKLWKFSAPLMKSGPKYRWSVDVSTEKTEVTLEYTYFTTTKKIAVDVDFKRYRDISPVWGKCSVN